MWRHLRFVLSNNFVISVSGEKIILKNISEKEESEEVDEFHGSPNILRQSSSKKFLKKFHGFCMFFKFKSSILRYFFCARFCAFFRDGIQIPVQNFFSEQGAPLWWSCIKKAIQKYIGTKLVVDDVWNVVKLNIIGFRCQSEIYFFYKAKEDPCNNLSFNKNSTKNTKSELALMVYAFWSS